MTRRLFAVLPLALIGAANPAEPPPAMQAQPARVISPQPAGCGTLESIAQGRDRLLMRRLGELPPGQAFMAVYRRDERGCIDPMLATERQGGGRR